MAEIQLVDVDVVITETTPLVAQEEGNEGETDAEVAEAPHIKRGRGRPPGAKNRVKSAPIPQEEEEEETEEEPPTPIPKKKPKKRVVVESSSEEEYEAPMPKKKRRPAQRPLTPVTRPPSPEPDSPRTQRHKMMQNSQNQRQARHAGRVQEYSSLLNEMLAY
jgi:hypothetical protein